MLTDLLLFTWLVALTVWVLYRDNLITKCLNASLESQKELRDEIHHISYLNYVKEHINGSSPPRDVKKIWKENKEVFSKRAREAEEEREAH